MRVLRSIPRVTAPYDARARPGLVEARVGRVGDARHPAGEED